MIELRERNNLKNIVSDEEINAFAWASIHANMSYILINNIKYYVVIEMKVNIILNDEYETGYGDWVVFINEEENNKRIINKNYLSEIRKQNPLTGQYVCFNDETFLNGGYYEKDNA